MDLQNKYQNLTNWLIQNGSYVNPKMGIRSEGTNGNGMFAKETISNEDLFNISNACLLNYENSKIPYSADEFDHRQKTTIALIYEMRNPSSFWKPYLELLPGFESFSNHPIFLSTRSNFSRVSSLINFYIDRSHDEYKSFLEKFRTYTNRNNFLIDLSDDEFLYCYLLTISRMWTGIGLIPIADLLQHSNTSHISLNKNENFANMKSVDTISSGQSIYDNYLLNDDIMLFINFGFVDGSDLITIPMNFAFEEQPQVISKLISREFDNIGKIYLTSDGINVNLMRYLRLNLLEMSDIDAIKDQSEFGNQIITLGNEFKALKKLKFRLSNYISQEDLVLLNSLNYSQNETEKSIFLILNRIFKLKEMTFSFVKKYWSDLID